MVRPNETRIALAYRTLLALALLTAAAWVLPPRGELCEPAFGQQRYELPQAQRKLPLPSFAQLPLNEPPANPGAELSEEVASPQRQIEIPFRAREGIDNIKLDSKNGVISLLFAQDADLKSVLTLIAQSEGLNLIYADDVSPRISISLKDVKVDDALNSLVAIAGFTWVVKKKILHVTSMASAVRMSPNIQGRRVQVFRLDYASALDLDVAVKGMLSPLGNSYVTTSDAKNNRKTVDTIVVEDLPEYLERIAIYVEQMDVPPRQVLIEVHVLEVDLSDDRKHGINFERLASINGNTITFQGAGFASPGAPQAFFLRIDGNNHDALIEALRSTTDAKTLASPKVLALNGQESRIQIGQQLGFRVTTTTETSTLENVDFIDVGVVLRVTPRISRDGLVMMRVKPEVSSGEVNPDTGLPQEETSEVETDIMLRDGQCMVIGGLIQEKDSNIQSKIPILGDIHLLGLLFQRRLVAKTRSEIVFVIVPRIVPYAPPFAERDAIDTMRAQTPLVYGALHRMPRPWEPRLDDPIEKPRHYLLPSRMRRLPVVDEFEEEPETACGCPECQGAAPEKPTAATDANPEPPRETPKTSKSAIGFLPWSFGKSRAKSYSVPEPMTARSP